MIVAASALLQSILVLFLMEGSGPAADALQNRNNGLPLLRKRVFDTGRNLIIRSALYYAVCNQLLESGGQDCIRDVDHLPSELAVTDDLLGCQYTDDAGLPLSSEDLKPILKWAAYILFKLSLIHLLPLQKKHKPTHSQKQVTKKFISCL